MKPKPENPLVQERREAAKRRRRLMLIEERAIALGLVTYE